MERFYRESSGDFIVVSTHIRDGYYHGAGTMAIGRPETITKQVVHNNYLHKCQSVQINEVPEPYLLRLNEKLRGVAV